MGEPENLQLLKQRVLILEHEWREAGVLHDLDQFELTFLEEHTASELGVAGRVTLGLAAFHSTAKVLLPGKVVTWPFITGAWVLGGAFILFRFTASTARGWAAMTQRNTRRKILLKRKLEAIQIHIQELAKLEASTATPPTAPAEPLISSPQHSPLSPEICTSPSGSTGSSIELVEVPIEIEKGGGASTSTAAAAAAAAAAEEEMEVSRRGSLESWRQYASLGRRKPPQK